MSFASSTLNKFTSNKPGDKRQATWLEVFFDLVFAVAVTQLGSYLHHHSNLTGYAMYAASFIPIWWAWMGFSYFCDVFDAEGKTYFKIVLLVTMLVVLTLALNTRDALTTTSFSLAAAYTVLQTLLVTLYVWARREVKETKKLCDRFMFGFGFGLALWFSSLFVPAPIRFVLWGIALAVEISTPLITYLCLERKPVHGSHLPYRLGQFTMIVIGETVAAVATRVADPQWQLPTIFTAVNGFASQRVAGLQPIVATGEGAIAVCLWWLYFSYVDRTSVDRALRRDNKELLKSFVYGYGHIAIFAGVAATGVGIELAINAVSQQTLSDTVRIPLFLGIATALIGLTIVHSGRSYCLPILNVLLRLSVASMPIAIAIFNLLTLKIAILTLVLLLIATVLIEEHCFIGDKKEKFS